MAEANAIILAAGLSTRMGERNKLLLDSGGMPLIRRVVRAYCAALKGPIFVVTGFEATRISAAVNDLPVRTIHNPHFADGQQTSVVAGLSNVSPDGPTILGLGDQPELTADDLTWLIAQHSKAPDKITIPHDLNGTRGNPIVIPKALRAQMLASPKSPGCRKFTRENPHLVRKVQSPSSGFFVDVDTPDDYARLKARAHDHVGEPQ